MRRLILFLALLSVRAEASPESDGAAFNAAMAADRPHDAAKILDRLIDQQRPADGQPVADALLNARVGRYAQATGASDGAEAYLALVDASKLPEAERASTALAYGAALERLGERQKALVAYRNALVLSGDGTRERRLAQLGAARQSIVADPLANRDPLLAIAALSSPADRWEAEYLLAVASSLAGDRASANAYSERAWSDAVKAPANEMAPLRVAVLRAGLAAAEKDRSTERAMLGAANGPMARDSGHLLPRLPVCGDDGIRPSDYVVIGAARSPYDNMVLIPIAASRPQVMAPFFDRISGFELIKSDDGAATGTVATLSCASAVSSLYVAKDAGRDPFTRWFAERGLYSAIISENDPIDFINEMGRRIEALETRFGKESLMLLQLNIQMLTALDAQARAGENIAPGRLIELRTSIAKALRRAGAPQGAADVIEMYTEMEQLYRAGQAGNPDFPAQEAIYRRLLMTVPFPMAQIEIADTFKHTSEVFAAAKARLYTALNSRAPATLNGRERQAWLRAVAEAQRAGGMDVESRSTLASAGFPADVCASSESGLNLVEQNFNSKDFPEDLIAGEQSGATAFELDIGADGTARSPRIILSMPSGLFDQIATARAAETRYTSPMRNGKAAACRGVVQRVKWQLPAGPNKNEFPTFAPPPAPEETS